MKEQYNNYINTINFQRKIFFNELYFFGYLQKKYFFKKKDDLEIFYEELTNEALFLKNLLFYIPEINNIIIKLDKKKIKEISFFLLLKTDRERLFNFLKLIFVFISIRNSLNFNINLLLYKKKLVLKFQNLNQLLKLLDKNYSGDFLNYTIFELKIESDFWFLNFLFKFFKREMFLNEKTKI